MTISGKRWSVYDREGNQIYLTEERWQHIVDTNNHPEVVDYEEHVKTTIRRGQRQQEILNPRKYRYVYPFDDLPEGFNHTVVIVLFGFDVNDQGKTAPNNFIATAFFKHIRLKNRK